MIHVHPLVLQLRFYDDGVDVSKPLQDMTEPYIGVANAILDSQGHAEVTLLHHDNFALHDYRDVMSQALKRYGVTKMVYRHKDKMHEVLI